MSSNGRTIWARGITSSDRGKAIRFSDGLVGLLKSVEHLSNVTTVSVVVSFDVSHDEKVEILD